MPKRHEVQSVRFNKMEEGLLEALYQDAQKNDRPLATHLKWIAENYMKREEITITIKSYDLFNTVYWKVANIPNKPDAFGESWKNDGSLEDFFKEIKKIRDNKS